MSGLEIALLVINVLLVILGYLMKDKVDKLEGSINTAVSKAAMVADELNAVKLNYLHRDDFKDFKLELRSMFEEIKSDVKALKVK